MPQLIVAATITAQPGSEAELTEVLQGLVAPTRLETGCVRYDLHRDAADPAVLVFLETWASREAHKAHMATPHFLAARAEQECLVASRSVRMLEQI
jgi:quinol monooxygenase YgiN